MPFTPFHFGPGAALHAVAPRHISFWSFCTANVLIDVEPLYYMLTHQPPLHRFFHTYIGATLIAVATIALFIAMRRCARWLALPNVLHWQALTGHAVALGAAAGVYSHILLDSLMHHDIQPLQPFSVSNPLLGLIPLAPLHWLCVGAVIFSLALIGLRAARRHRKSRC